MKKLLAALCIISFNAIASQVVPEEVIKEKKEKLDAILNVKAEEHLRVENAAMFRRCVDDPTVTPEQAKENERVQTISRMASTIQKETAKFFINAPILNDLELRKALALKIIGEQDPVVQKKMRREAREDMLARAELERDRNAKRRDERQQALKQKWGCCWVCCDGE